MMAYRLECPACQSRYVIPGKQGERHCRKCGYRGPAELYEHKVTLVQARALIEEGVCVITTEAERKRIEKGWKDETVPETS